MAALLVFMLTSLEFLKEKDCLRRDFYFGCKVIKKSSSNRKINKKGYILKANN